MKRVGDIVPEIVLRNSHDGSSQYVIYAGLFRLICLNGMIVSDGTVECIRARHSGWRNTADRITDATFEIIDRMPNLGRRVNEWRNIHLDEKLQLEYAECALEILPTALTVDPRTLLEARRDVDMNVDGERDLWRTMNVIQENVTKGGLAGTNANGAVRNTRAIGSLDVDIKFNRALWQLTEEIAG
jgi:hypothetical protein